MQIILQLFPLPLLTFTQTQRLLTVNNSNDGQLRLFSVTGPNNSPTLTDNGIIDFGVNNGWSNNKPGAPQPLTFTTINTGDPRMAACVLRGGYLWWANSFGLPKIPAS